MAGVGTGLVGEGQTIDITTATSMTMWMKGSAPGMVVHVEIATADIADFAFYEQVFILTADRAQYTIDFTDFINFTQPSWTTTPVEFNKTQVQKIQ